MFFASHSNAVAIRLQTVATLIERVLLPSPIVLLHTAPIGAHSMCRKATPSAVFVNRY